MTLQVPKVIPNDWNRLRLIIDKLKYLRLGLGSNPTFAGLILTGLTASSLLQTDADKKLESIALPLIVAKGGTGATTLTDHGILLGSGTDAVTPLGVAGDGYIPIGSAGADPVLARITGTSNQIISTPGAGSITLSTPQDIHTGATPTFAGLNIAGTIDASSGEVLVEDNNADVPADKSDGYIGVAIVGGTAKVYFAVNGAMYYIDGTTVAVPVTGNPIGLLLTLTYNIP